MGPCVRVTDRVLERDSSNDGITSFYENNTLNESYDPYHCNYMQLPDPVIYFYMDVPEEVNPCTSF